MEICLKDVADLIFEVASDFNWRTAIFFHMNAKQKNRMID